MLEALFELLFEFVGEFVLQIVLELLVEVGLRPLVEPFRQRPTPWVAAIGYLLFGAAVGGLSLLAFPQHFVHNPVLRVVNTFATPLCAGAVMAALGHWRQRQGQVTSRLDRFAYGFLFALGLAVVRYFFAR
jgi:hypothetical protein